MSNSTHLIADPASSHTTHPRFVVVGAGGLGCPALMGLLAAGAREFTIVDFDHVEAHNLQRQVLFNLGDVGSPKASAAAHALRSRSRSIRVRSQQQRLQPADAKAFVADLHDSDVVLECSDHSELKFALNDACRAKGQPFVVGGVVGWQGRAMAVHGAGACYRCFFEAPPPAQGVARCADAGVLGAGAGIVGQLMAALAWQLALRQARQNLAARDVAGRLHVMDMRDLSPRVLQPPRRANCPACALATAASSAQFASA